MLFLLQTSLYSGILYAIYLVALRNHSSHSWNRFYLLLCGTLPFLLPFIHIPGISGYAPLDTDRLDMMLPEITIFSNGGNVSTGNISINEWFTISYLAISAILLLYLAGQYIMFRRFLSRQHDTKYAGDIRIITGCGMGPGSFGKYIFFPDNETDPKILEHEVAHVRLLHSVDIIIMKVMQCLFWPNVMLYLIIKELKVVHEFQADIILNKNKDEYIRSLLNGILGTNRFSLSHTFFHHPIKRRIDMLQKKPQSRSMLRTVSIRSGIAATLLIAGGIYLQSCKPQPDASTEISTYKKVPGDNQEAYYSADTMPESMVNIMEFLGENVRYPENARRKQIEGKVIVQFIVDAEGYIKSPKVLKSPDSTLSEEAIRAIMSMPKWKPGSKDGKHVPVYFNIPISFKLS